MEPLQPYPFHFVLGEALLGSVIELRRTWAFMCCHFLGVLKSASVGEIGGDPGRTECVAADGISACPPMALRILLFKIGEI
jgi:hypothetical protein